MDASVIAAVIGACATLAAAGITAFAYWRNNTKRHEHDDLGEWVAEWIPDTGGEITRTRLKFTLGPDNRVVGAGEGGHSRYSIEGVDSPFASAFSYRGHDLRKRNIVGVFIVKKWPDDRMEGSWHQLSSENTLESGRVTLKRP